LKPDTAASASQKAFDYSQLLDAQVNTIRSSFYAHNSRSQSLIEERLQQIKDAQNVTDGLALIEPFLLTTKCLVSQLRYFKKVLKNFDYEIEQLFESHPDHFLFESFPGAGKQPGPRLLAVFCSDRAHWLPPWTSKSSPESLPSLKAAENLSGFIAGFPALNSSAKPSMNLPSTPFCVLPGQNSSTDVSVRKVSPAIVQSAPWPSNGSALLCTLEG
jgi:hypothetical protein